MTLNDLVRQDAKDLCFTVPNLYTLGQTNMRNSIQILHDDHNTIQYTIYFIFLWHAIACLCWKCR